MTIKLPGSVSAMDPGYGQRVRNWSVAAEVVAAATATYLAGSAIAIPSGMLLRAGAKLSWIFDMTKTAAGTATSTFSIVFGTAGTTADTARVSFTKPAGTAAIDKGTVRIDALVRTEGASGVVIGNFQLTHNLAATGHAQIPVVDLVTVSSAFDLTVDSLIAGIVATTGASDAITVQALMAEADGIR